MAYEPISSPSEARLRTLRRRRACSAGFRETTRSITGLNGSRHWYSSLAVWSAILLRSGREAEAIAGSREAESLESQWQAIGWTPGCPATTASQQLAVETEELSQQLLDLLAITHEAAVWASVRDEEAIVETRSGDSFRLPLDSPQLDQSRLGDPLIVVHHQTTTGIDMRFVVPGMRIEAAPSEVPASRGKPEIEDSTDLFDPPADNQETGDFFSRLLSGPASQH